MQENSCPKEHPEVIPICPVPATPPALPSQQPPPITNPIARALMCASKTDPFLVVLCSRWAQATQAAFGLFVLFTTTLAFCAAYYTLSTLGVAGLWPFLIATVWAVFILFLDREIVGGLDKSTAAVRLLLALIVGTIVAIPIELFVFQNRIDQELARQYRLDNKEQLDQLRGEETQMQKRRADLQTTLVTLRKEEADWGHAMDDELVGRPNDGRTGVSGAGPVYENAQAQQEAVRERIQEVRRDLADLEHSMPEERQRLEKHFQREEVAKVTDFTSRYEGLHTVIHSSSALYRLSWGVTLFFILLEMTPAILKVLTPHVDYHHLVSAEIRENIARIDEIADRNYRLAIENPESPELSVSEKFAGVRYRGVPNESEAHETDDDAA